MFEHIFFFIYILTVGATFSVLTLSLLYWLRQRNKGRFSTFLFIGYLTFILLLVGVRFYWEGILSGGKAVTIGTGFAELTAYTLLIYHLPATMNHIIGRPWTPLRLSASLVACAVYFALGAVYLLTGLHLALSLVAALLYFLALMVILAGILKSIPLIPKVTTRITVLVVTLLTVAFLPLVMAGRIMTEVEGPWQVHLDLRFLFLTLYYFWMAVTGIIFYFRELVHQGQDKASESIVISKDLSLTNRERDIASSLVQGLTYGKIAEKLRISPHTVRNHIANVYNKLAVRSKMELMRVLRGDRRL